jgi:hypothetical protein
VGSLGGRASSGGHHAPGAKEEVGREAEREEREEEDKVEERIPDVSTLVNLRAGDVFHCQFMWRTDNENFHRWFHYKPAVKYLSPVVSREHAVKIALRKPFL